MDISKATIASVVLLSLSVGMMAPPLFQVYVTNFPLDEQGNLRVRTIEEEKPSQIHNDAIEIDALEWTKQSHYTDSSQGGTTYDYGIRLTNDIPLMIPFAFSPKQAFLNVTSIWVKIVSASRESGSYKFNLNINDITVSTGEILHASTLTLRVVSSNVSEPVVCSTVISGINKLTLTEPMKMVQGQWQYADIYVYRVTVFIEYKYQA